MTNDPLTLVAAFLIGSAAVGRAARLLTHDDFPPAAAVRSWWLVHTGDWGTLFVCPFCMAPYLAAADLGWAVLAGLSWDNGWAVGWWLVNVWAAAAYAAAILVAYDEPAGDE